MKELVLLSISFVEDEDNVLDFHAVEAAERGESWNFVKFLQIWD